MWAGGREVWKLRKDVGMTGGLAPSRPHHHSSLHELSYLRFDFLEGGDSFAEGQVKE